MTFNWLIQILAEPTTQIGSYKGHFIGHY